MVEYVHSRTCLMQFLARELDEHDAAACGRCANCVGRPMLEESFASEIAQRAAQFLRRTYHPIAPRRLWPRNAFTVYPFAGRISKELSAEEGRVLAIWGDAGWGELVRLGKYGREGAGHFDEQLVTATMDMIQQWNPEPRPAWVTCVPSLNRVTLVPDFGEQLARALSLPFHPALRKVRATLPQKEMQNSFQQARNLDGAFAVEQHEDISIPVLLVDDMVDSGWTLSVCAVLLRQAGSGPVFPVALAQTSKSDDA
jgi:ATP-dependent DNA helicase RecQ